MDLLPIQHKMKASVLRSALALLVCPGPPGLSTGAPESAVVEWRAGAQKPLTPDKYERLLENPLGPADSRYLLSFTQADKPALIRLFKSRRPIETKNRVALALAYLGGDDVFALFTKALTNDFVGKVVGRSGESGLEFLVLDLGILAQREDRAFTFLSQAISPAHWEKVGKWRGSDPFSINFRLTQESIVALGMSGRPASLSLLLQLKDQPLVYRDKGNQGTFGTFDGVVVEAAFHYWLVSVAGIDKYRQAYATERMEGLRTEWRSSAQGKEWYIWFQRRLTDRQNAP